MPWPNLGRGMSESLSRALLADGRYNILVMPEVSAMMKLFGGFPAACFDAYFEESQQVNKSTSQQGGKPLAASRPDDDELYRRIAVYQLYHVLNHVNLFGRGYVEQALSLARTIL